MARKTFSVRCEGNIVLELYFANNNNPLERFDAYCYKNSEEYTHIEGIIFDDSDISDRATLDNSHVFAIIEVKNNKIEPFLYSNSAIYNIAYLTIKRILQYPMILFP